MLYPVLGVHFPFSNHKWYRVFLLVSMLISFFVQRCFRMGYKCLIIERFMWDDNVEVMFEGIVCKDLIWILRILRLERPFTQNFHTKILVQCWYRKKKMQCKIMDLDILNETLWHHLLDIVLVHVTKGDSNTEEIRRCNSTKKLLMIGGTRCRFSILY